MVLYWCGLDIASLCEIAALTMLVMLIANTSCSGSLDGSRVSCGRRRTYLAGGSRGEVHFGRHFGRLLI
jgi:hypothetical protein